MNTALKNTYIEQQQKQIATIMHSVGKIAVDNAIYGDIGKCIANLVNAYMVSRTVSSTYMDGLIKIVKNFCNAKYDKNLEIFKKIKDGDKMLRDFEDEFIKHLKGPGDNPGDTYYSDLTHDVEALFAYMDILAGCDTDGHDTAPSPYRMVKMAKEDEEEFRAYMARKKKKIKFMEEQSYDKPMHMAGWNATKIVQVKENKDWIKYNSIAEAAKYTGYCAKKISTAQKTNTAYKGCLWMTEDDYEYVQERLSKMTDEEKRELVKP